MRLRTRRSVCSLPKMGTRVYDCAPVAMRTRYAVAPKTLVGWNKVSDEAKYACLLPVFCQVGRKMKRCCEWAHR
ncbi:MAG: hypothetical protein RR482_08635, partial [Clostridia bacterium]